MMLNDFPPYILGLAAGFFTWFVTALGALGVFFFKGDGKKTITRFLGSGAGVMLAASFWSLLLPAVDAERQRGSIPWLMPVIGFTGGFAFMMISGILLERSRRLDKGKRSCALIVTAVTLHNFPEGMAVGVAFGAAGGAYASAIAVMLGIAIQNFPEGAAVSLPLYGQGMKRSKAFMYGQMSGVVEPIGALIGALLAQGAAAALPVLLSFAAGAMIFVAVHEIIPETDERYRAISTAWLCAGFSLMTLLDIALG